MRLFDVLGPVMIGPSSSHTAGAARIGYTAQKLLGEVPAKADIGLYGSLPPPARATAPTGRWWRVCWACARMIPACRTALRWQRNRA